MTAMGTLLALSLLELTLIIALAVIVLAVIIGAMFFIYRSKNKQRIENQIENDVSTNVWLDRHLLSIPADGQAKTMFYLYQVDFFNADEIIKKIGNSAYREILSRLCLNLARRLPLGIKITYKNYKSINIYTHSDINSEPEQTADSILTATKEFLSKENIYSEINVAAVTYPMGGQDTKTLMKNLETAMVASRRKSPGSYAFFTEDLAIKEKADVKYYQEISEAINTKEFTLFYQPIIDKNTMEVKGAESLIRWKHRKLGILPPANFLHIMEQTGDINWAGFWCFEEMIKQMNIWFSNYNNRFMVGINISEKQLLNPELSERLFDIVKKYKTDPSSVVIEITDFSLYKSSQVTKTNVKKLKEYGFMLAYDGCKSLLELDVLQEYPLNIIKLDSRLWRKSDNNEINNALSSLVKYCDDNNIMLVAHGIEDKKDFEAVYKLGIKYMQGYAFAKPGEPQEFFAGVVSKPWKAILLF